jgi:hypothetical protein
MTHTHAKPHIQAQTDTLKVNNSITITVETNAIKLQITMASNKKNVSVEARFTRLSFFDKLTNQMDSFISPTTHTTQVISNGNIDCGAHS